MAARADGVEQDTSHTWLSFDVDVATPIKTVLDVTGLKTGACRLSV